jgi:Nitrile hydratase, alpha chain
MRLTDQERVTSDVIAPEEVLESERGSLISGLVIARAWRDSDYLARLVADPREVLAAAGLQIPPGMKIRVVQDAPGVRHVALTSLTTEPEEMLPLWRELLPLPEGSEVRLIQNTEQALCLVVPLAPAGPEAVTDVEVLRRLAPRASVFASGDVVQSMAEAFTASEAALLGAAEASAEGAVEASVFTSGDVAQSSAEAFTVSEAALLGAAEVSAASSAQSAGSAQAAAEAASAAAASTSVVSNTNQVTNTFAVAEAQVDAVAQAAVAVAAVEVEAVATTTTAAAEAEAVAVVVIVLT